MLRHTVLLLVLPLVMNNAIAEPMNSPPICLFHSTTQIGAETARGMRGIGTFNLAAGMYNQQFNGIAAAIGVHAEASVTSIQHVDVDARNLAFEGHYTVSIEAGAFHHYRGALVINQASGAANLQANGIVLSLGKLGEAVAENQLAATVSGKGLANLQAESPAVTGEVSISDRAFRGAQGLVQVSQVAGVANTTANRFVLRMYTDVNQH